MKRIEISNQFKRDLKNHYLISVSYSWIEVMHCLIHNLSLHEKYRDHELRGNLAGIRDCHIRPDLILLYEKSDDLIQLLRLNSHSELNL